MTGDQVVLIDGSGAEADGEIASLDRSGAEVSVLAVRPAGDPGPAIWLGVCAVRAERIAWIAEKAGELAVATLALVRSERTQAFRAADGAPERLERLAREAAKQSGGTRWPRCEGPIDFARALEPGGAGAEGVGGVEGAEGKARFFFDASGAAFPVSLAGGAASILIGPEGGWTEGERAAAAAAGWTAVRLPAATLRTETAAVAAVVLTRAALERGEAS